MLLKDPVWIAKAFKQKFVCLYIPLLRRYWNKVFDYLCSLTGCVLDQDIESDRGIVRVSFNNIPEGRQEVLVRAGVTVKHLNFGGRKLEYWERIVIFLIASLRLIAELAG